MNFSILSSGSKQNCFYLEDGETSILIDIGVSYPSLIRLLKMVEGDITGIKALFITHEHQDHTNGLHSFIKNTKIPVYIHEKSRFFLDHSIHENYTLIESKPVTIGKLIILPFRVSHDAANTYGFKITHKGKSLFLASDIGSFNEEIIGLAKNTDAIAIESNYDREMLKTSRYPAYLKMRINGNNGHLSNEDAATFLEMSIGKNTKNVFFLHLSENNNSSEKVEKLIGGLSVKFPQTRYHISKRESPLGPVEI